ncbi:MAG TPA: (2Fe-2S)-binding protein [Ignavibacteriales bacterium]|nr:(2Fe-2S)-binding protein [Ignavibacteriales bacterium]
MSKDSKNGGISRRKFLQGMGSGIIGTYVLTPAVSSATEKLTKNAEKLRLTMPLTMKVNGKQVHIQVEPRTTLAEVLREQLGLTGTKVVCNNGECGGCTVLMDQKAVYSCHILALDCSGKEITTIEGLMKADKLNPVQEAFIEHDGLQCGFCTPGQIMAAEALLLKNSRPTRDEVLEGMSGNICRCAAYPNIIESVLSAADKLRNESSSMK